MSEALKTFPPAAAYSLLANVEMFQALVSPGAAGDFPALARPLQFRTACRGCGRGSVWHTRHGAKLDTGRIVGIGFET